MRILCTGSAGFIGRHTVAELLEANHEIIGVDRNHKIGDSIPVWWRYNLADPGNARWVMKESKPDVVLHLAARIFRRDCEFEPERTIADNITATTMVARACGELGVPLVYVSSSEIYGDVGGAISDEYSGPFSMPHNLYGLTKRQGEEICYLYAPDGLLILRLCMPYGPDCPTGVGRAALPSFIDWARQGEPITVHRGAERSWCWISDTTRAIRLLLEQERAGIYNVGQDLDRFSMQETAELVCELVGASKNLIEIVDPPAAQTLVKRLSFERLYNLGWQPQVRLREGIERVIQTIA